MDKTKLGDRMKTYEEVSNIKLLRRTPVIVRLDGRAFHTFTRGFDKPFDEEFTNIMQQTMKYMCEITQNCVLGYTQSDEITLILIDYKDTKTDVLFDNRIQKLCSILASECTLYFNKLFLNYVSMEDENDKLIKKLFKAVFDCRVFNVPQYEVCNNLIWRQQDATRNSINSLAQSLFSHKELQGIKCNDLQNKMLTEKDVNWNNLSTYLKRGSCAIKNDESKWIIDKEIPIFVENRDYINKRILLDE